MNFFDKYVLSGM